MTDGQSWEDILRVQDMALPLYLEPNTLGTQVGSGMKIHEAISFQ